MLNRIMLIGRLGKDPVLKTSKNNKPYTQFSMVTETGFKDNKRSDWHNVSAFGHTAEFVCKYLKKGALVYVEGELHYDKYKDKEGNEVKSTTVFAGDVKPLGKREGGQQPAQQQPVQPVADYSGGSADFGGYIPDDDIPF